MLPVGVKVDFLPLDDFRDPRDFICVTHLEQGSAGNPVKEVSLKSGLDLCRVEQALRLIIEEGAQTLGGLIDLWIARRTALGKMIRDFVGLVHRPQLRRSNRSLQLKWPALDFDFSV